MHVDLGIINHPVKDLALLLLGRITNLHLHHKSVDLRLGQRIGTLLFDGVLRRQNQKRIIEWIRIAADRHLPLLHRLEQSTLNLGRGAIHLIRQDNICENRPLFRHELAGALIEDESPRQIGGE